jgi:hypothetical protein
MSGSGTTTTNTSQSSSTQPWTEALPLLRNMLSSYGGLDTSVTPAQTAAASTLSSEAGSLPEMGSDITATLQKMFGSDTTPQVGMLNTAYGNMQRSLNPLTDPNNLNPYNTPGFSDALKTLTSDITNNVKGVYSGAGRDPSGAGSFAQSLSRGLMQGEAPVVASQYNANVGALENSANALENAGVTTAGAITGQNQVPITNASGAVSLIPAATTGATAPGAAQLAAANTGYNLPYGNLAALLQPAIALGALGQQSSGTGTSTTQGSSSPFSNILGGLMGGTGILSNMGAFGPSGWLLASDARVKDDIKKVGMLHDGQPVFSYRYKGQPETRIGLLAQETLKHHPEAVGDIGAGLLGVDYAKATENAAEMAT